MMINDYVGEKMIDKSINLFPILGIKELAWHYNDVFEILDKLNENGAIIYGGDVIKKTDVDKFSYTYDSWLYNGINPKDSYNIAQDYIATYCKKNGTNYYFILVVK